MINYSNFKADSSLNTNIASEQENLSNIETELKQKIKKILAASSEDLGNLKSSAQSNLRDTDIAAESQKFTKQLIAQSVEASYKQQTIHSKWELYKMFSFPEDREPKA